MQRSRDPVVIASASDSILPKWSPENDKILIKTREQGFNFKQIAPMHFPEKSARACMKRHAQPTDQEKKEKKEKEENDELELVVMAYVEVRSEMWKALGARVGMEWQRVEQIVSIVL